MSALALIVILLCFGVIWWLINIKYAANVGMPLRWLISIIIVTAVLLTLDAFGIWAKIKDVQVPKL